MSFWTRAADIPPILVRLLARRRHGPPLTDADIARQTGLPIHQVFIISQSTDWSGIDLPTMRKFLCACGVDFEDPEQMNRIESYLRHTPTYKYLRVSPHWPTYFEPLMRRYLNSRKANPTT